MMPDSKGVRVTGRTIESRIALAMLPLGAAMTLAAALGLLGAVALALSLLWRWPANVGWWLAWSAAAGAAAAYILRKGIETMSTFDWHVAVAPLAVAAAIAAACPGWWF
jgi:hypothetical protein